VLAKNPEATIYAGMHEVRPGQIVGVRPRGLTKRATGSSRASSRGRFCRATNQTVAELLEDIVQRQIVSDVPLCSLPLRRARFSTVTAMAHRAIVGQNGKRLRSFSVDFAEHGARLRSGRVP